MSIEVSRLKLPCRLIGLLAGCAILAILLSCLWFWEERGEQPLGHVLEAVENVLAAEQEFREKPDLPTRGRLITASIKFFILRHRYGISDLEEFFRSHSMILLEWDNRTYLGGIIEVRKVDGVTVYLTSTGAKEFRALRSILFQGTNPVYGSTFTDRDGSTAIYLEIAPIERSVKVLHREWKLYIENNQYFHRGDLRWKPKMQALYNVLKGVPLSEIAKRCREEFIESSISHELMHIRDDDSNFTSEDLETRAYLAGLKKSPIVLHQLERLSRSEGKLYPKTAAKIMEGLMGFPDIKTKRDLYRLPRSEVSRRAEILADRWYSKKPS